MPRTAPRRRPLLHPLQSLLLAWPVALFPAALISDITYYNSAEIQWTNMSAWMLVGALFFGGIALLWAIIGMIKRHDTHARRPYRSYVLLLAAAWATGLVNAFQHSHDGWSSVGAMGLFLSTLSTLLVLAAGWVAHMGYREVSL